MMKISVITATFNSAATLRDTIESVLAQTYKDIEYIVVDGNSSDETLKIVREYAPAFKGKLKVVSEPDRGIYDAMNKGVSMATGDVVGILNSDDFYSSPNVIEEIVRVISASDIDAVYGDVHYVHPCDTGKCVRYYSSRLFYRTWMRLGFMPAHPSFYCRRTIYEQFGAFDLSYKVAADFENLLRLIYVHRIRTKYLPLDFVTMRTGGASSSGFSSHKQIMLDHLRALRNHNIYSNSLLLSLRYVYKMGEVLKSRAFPPKTSSYLLTKAPR